jgi:hypothetical protein
MTQMRLIVLVASALLVDAIDLLGGVVKTSDGDCWLELSIVQIPCCEAEHIMAWPGNDLFFAQPCTDHGIYKECDYTRSEKTLQQWVDECREQDIVAKKTDPDHGKDICVDGRAWTYRCDTPAPTNAVPIDQVPLPGIPGTPAHTPLMIHAKPDPMVMCHDQTGPGQVPFTDTMEVCVDQCMGMSCKDYLIKSSTFDSEDLDSGSNDPSVPDTIYTCQWAFDEVLEPKCPQCTPDGHEGGECDVVGGGRLFSEGPRGGWPLGRGASVAAAAATLGGIAAAAVLAGAAVLRKRRCVWAQAGEPLAAGADAEASDAVDSEQ